MLFYLLDCFQSLQCADNLKPELERHAHTGGGDNLAVANDTFLRDLHR